MSRMHNLHACMHACMHAPPLLRMPNTQCFPTVTPADNAELLRELNSPGLDAEGAAWMDDGAALGQEDEDEDEEGSQGQQPRGAQNWGVDDIDGESSGRGVVWRLLRGLGQRAGDVPVAFVEA